MSKIQFLVMTKSEIAVDPADRRPCTLCGDPECDSTRPLVRANVFPESDRDKVLAMLGDGPDRSTALSFTEDGSLGIGTHYRGGPTIAMELHGDIAPDKVQIFALTESQGVPLVWEGPRVEGDLDPVKEGIERFLSYAPPAVATPAPVGSLEQAPVFAAAG